MALPQALLPHSATLVRPAATTDAYGNTALDYGASATRSTITAWLQQGGAGSVGGSEPREDGRDADVGTWLMVTNASDVQAADRIEWTGPTGAVVFEVDGPPEPAYTPAGFHHTEISLRVVTG